MKRMVNKSAASKWMLGALLAGVFGLTAHAVEDREIPDESLGLSKTSVFDTPAPDVTEYSASDPGTVGKRVERSYHTAPPMVPHSIKDMTPIRQDFNLCKDCHVQPEMIDQEITQGVPVPAPASHYVDVKKGDLYMGRWNCTQCHAPQADVKNLVVNTFKKPEK